MSICVVSFHVTADISLTRGVNGSILSLLLRAKALKLQGVEEPIDRNCQRHEKPK